MRDPRRYRLVRLASEFLFSLKLHLRNIEVIVNDNPAYVRHELNERVILRDFRR